MSQQQAKKAFTVIVNAGKLVLLSNRHDYWVHNGASSASLIHVVSVSPHSPYSESNIVSHGSFFDHHDAFAVALLPTLNECPLHASVICTRTGKFNIFHLRHASPELLSSNRNSLETKKKHHVVFLSKISFFHSAKRFYLHFKDSDFFLSENSSYSP